MTNASKKNDSKKDVQIVKADRRLQMKAGSGLISSDRILKSQKIIEDNTVDFLPIAADLLNSIAIALQAAKNNSSNAMEPLKRPIMIMKAEAALFGFPLVSILTGTMLDFLESHESVDNDILKIVEVHLKSLQFIISHKMRGDGGAHGSAFRTELENVCQRYAAKGYNKRVS